MTSLTIEVPDDLKRQIEENAEQRGLAVSEFVRPALQQLVVEVPNPTAAPGQDDRPIWEVIVDLMTDLPPEELEKLPTDLAAEHDHYIYGLPKRTDDGPRLRPRQTGEQP